MAWRNGFHNSVGNDRTYNADDLSQIFDGLITEGIIPDYKNELKVSAGSGMQVIVATGKGWFNSRYGDNTTDMELDISASDPLLNRWDAIVVKGDNSDEVRDTYVYVKEGTPASSPDKPTMESTATVKEYCLAYVYVGAGATEITDANITDTRSDDDLCGFSAALYSGKITLNGERYKTRIGTEGAEGYVTFVVE